MRRITVPLFSIPSSDPKKNPDLSELPFGTVVECEGQLYVVSFCADDDYSKQLVSISNPGFALDNEEWQKNPKKKNKVLGVPRKVILEF